MPEAARLPWFGPIPPLVIGAVIGVSMFALHGIGAIILTLVGVGIAMKWIYRWHANGGQAPAWPACAGKWRQYRQQATQPPSSGNHAFDDYRAEMLRRLEQDQQEFQAFLERLRRAKDKAEFDQFMAERDRRPPANPAGGNGQPLNPWPNA